MDEDNSNSFMSSLCVYCDITFEDEQELDRHIIDKHFIVDDHGDIDTISNAENESVANIDSLSEGKLREDTGINDDLGQTLAMETIEVNIKSEKSNIMSSLCGYCNIVFEDEPQLDRHIVDEHFLPDDHGDIDTITNVTNERVANIDPLSNVKIHEGELREDTEVNDDLGQTLEMENSEVNVKTEKVFEYEYHTTISEEPDINLEVKKETKKWKQIVNNVGKKKKKEVSKQDSVKNTNTLGKFGKKLDWTSFYTNNGDKVRCVSCEIEYNSASQMLRHLKTSPCGDGVQPQILGKCRGAKSPPQNYKGLYKKEDDLYYCAGCLTSYQSIRGVHSHLKKTLCGFGNMSPKAPNFDYRDLYKQEGMSWQCLACQIIYHSSNGMHYHLRNTKCGFGTE